jgi:hypothetical protein
LTGHVFIDGAPAESSTRLRLVTAPSGVPRLDALLAGPLPAGGVLTVDNAGKLLGFVSPGRAALRSAGPMGLQSVTADGVDVTDGFEVTRAVTVDVHLTSQVSVLEGIVKPSDGIIAGDCDVVVFAADPREWRTPLSRRLVTVRCDAKGKFRVMGLPAGQYFAAIPADFDRRMWADPERLERWRPFATPFTVGDGAVTEIQLEVRR